MSEKHVPRATDIRLGTSGWSYKDWLGPFYPPGTRPRDYLRVYAGVFPAVEVDSTFYAVPRRSGGGCCLKTLAVDGECQMVSPSVCATANACGPS